MRITLPKGYRYVTVDTIYCDFDGYTAEELISELNEHRGKYDDTHEISLSVKQEQEPYSDSPHICSKIVIQRAENVAEYEHRMEQERLQRLKDIEWHDNAIKSLQKRRADLERSV